MNIDEKISKVKEILKENSDDEETWAIFGDLLQEKGDPRGELITLECFIRDADISKKVELLKRKKKIEKQYYRTISNIITDCEFDYINSRYFHIKYGYLLHINLNNVTRIYFEKLINNDISQFLYSIESFTGGYYSEIVNHLNNVKIKNLSILADLYDPDMDDIDHKNFSSLKVLRICNNRLTKPGIQKILQSKHFSLLDEIDFTNSRFIRGTELVTLICMFNTLPLKKLTLTSCDVKDSDLELLSNYLSSVEVII